MEPKLIIAVLEKSTYVFLGGKCISNGITDFSYHARGENGEVCPGFNADIDIQSFSFEGMTFDEFWEKIKNLREEQNGAESVKD